MMKINVYSEKSGNFGANSEKKPMIIIESKKRPLGPGKKDKNGKFPLGTINYLAYEKLKKFSKIGENKSKN